MHVYGYIPLIRLLRQIKYPTDSLQNIIHSVYSVLKVK